MISLVTLFIGRFHCLKEYFKGLEDLDYDKKKIHLIWHDTSHIPFFTEKLQEWLAEHGEKYASVTFLECDKPHYHFEEKNGGHKALVTISQAYNHCVKYLKGDYFFSLEDDVVCPPNALRKLLVSLEDKTIVGAAGRMIARPSSLWQPGKVIAWRFDKVEVFPGENIEFRYVEKVIDYLKDDGKELVGATHLGCTLIRAGFVRNNPFKPTDDGLSTGPDVIMGYKAIKEGLAWVLDWSIKCKHFDVDGEWV